MIEDQDIYGEPVILKFNKKDWVHKTVFGGVATLFVKCLMLVYMSILVQRMVLYQSTSNKSFNLQFSDEQRDAYLK